MRTFVFLSALALVAGDETGTCIIDGAEAVSDALDASMFIWASIARCGPGDGLPAETKCVIGISSAVNSLNKMVNIILHAIDKCGALNTVNKECGLAMSELTTSASGITMASGGIAQKCFQGDGVNGLEWHHADAALCVVNVKDTAQSIFKVVKAFLKLEKSKPCESGDQRGCAEKSLAIIGAFAGVGEYLAGSVGHCAPQGEYHGANCGAQAARLAQQLTDFSKDAIDVARKCTAPPEKAKEIEEISAETKVLPGGAAVGPQTVTGRTFDIVGDGHPVSNTQPPQTHVVDVKYDVKGDGKKASSSPPAGVDPAVWGTGPDRLYSASKKQVGGFGPAALTNVILAASLPLTAIVAFVGGRFYGLRRNTHNTREVVPLSEE